MHTHRILLTLAALAALPGAARAQVNAKVTPTVTATGPAGFSFSYALTDTGSSPLGDFLLNVPSDVTLTSETAPSGWLIFYTPSADVIEWASTDSSTDIAAGSSLSGFGFSAPAAGTQTYEVRSFDDNTTASGTTLGPAAPVPEASSIVSLGLLLMLGLGGVAVARRKAGA